MKKKQDERGQQDKAKQALELEVELQKAEQAFATGLRAGVAKACGTVCGTRKTTK
jgi:hypothetical protein